MTKQKSMSDIWAQLQKEHGDEGLFMGNQDMTTYSDVISTGSLALDDALGIWGIPKGHIVQYAGFESSGKTLLSLATIAQWQKLNPRNWALFIDAELSFEPTWAEKQGVDLSRLFVFRENRADKIFERLVGRPNKPNQKGEITKVKQGILDLEIEAGPEGTGLGIIVIDSIASMQPPMEQARSVEKNDIALMARFLPPSLRKLTPLLSKTGVTLIAINQLRFKPDVMYGDPTDSPGGTALKFACSQMINLGMIGRKDSLLLNENGDRVGHHIRAKVQKNKKSSPHREAEFAIEYERGVVNRNIEVRDIGAKYGIILRPNNVTYELDGVKYKGKDAIAEALLNEELMNDVLERSKIAKRDKMPILSVSQEDLEDDSMEIQTSDEE